MDVIGVHGIGKHQLGRNTLLQTWQQSLRDGIERFTGYPGPQVSCEIAFYGDIFLPAASEEKGDSNAWPSLVSDDEADFLAELTIEYAAASGQSPGGAVDYPNQLKGMPGVPVPLRGLVGVLARRADLGMALAVVPILRQVWRYLQDDVLAKRVRDRVVRVALSDHPAVLIGHSLGSVVAYETLALEEMLPVQALLTLGSPLRLRAVRRRLRTTRGDLEPLPPVVNWVNILDPADPVACAGGMRGLGLRTEDVEVNNGRGDRHSVLRYLNRIETGTALASVILNDG
jgi:hypothetical protein